MKSCNPSNISISKTYKFLETRPGLPLTGYPAALKLLQKKGRNPDNFRQMGVHP